MRALDAILDPSVAKSGPPLHALRKMLREMIVVLGFALVGSCIPAANVENRQTGPADHKFKKTSRSPMQSSLNGLGYSELFAMRQGRQVVERLGVIEMEKFLRDSAGDAYERVLIAELLYDVQQHYVLSDNEMAQLHASAMTQAPMHNPWGLPGEPADFGESVLKLGAGVELALEPLLSNNTPLRYVGSEEPTIAGM